MFQFCWSVRPEEVTVKDNRAFLRTPWTVMASVSYLLLSLLIGVLHARYLITPLQSISASASSCCGVAVDPMNPSSVYCSPYSSSPLTRLTVNTSTLGTVGVVGSDAVLATSLIAKVTVDPRNNRTLYYADYFSGRVVRVNLNSAYSLDSTQVVCSGFGRAEGVAVDPMNNHTIYCGPYTSDYLLRVTLDGSGTPLSSVIVVSGFTGVEGIVVDPKNNRTIYVADPYGGCVWRVTIINETSGEATKVKIFSSSMPSAVAVSRRDNTTLFVSDWNAGIFILSLDPLSGYGVSHSVLGISSGLTGVAYDDVNGILYGSTQYSGTISLVNVTLWRTPTKPQSMSPSEILSASRTFTSDLSKTVQSCSQSASFPWRSMSSSTTGAFSITQTYDRRNTSGTESATQIASRSVSLSSCFVSGLMVASMTLIVSNSSLGAAVAIRSDDSQGWPGLQQAPFAMQELKVMCTFQCLDRPESTVSGTVTVLPRRRVVSEQVLAALNGAVSLAALSGQTASTSLGRLKQISSNVVCENLYDGVGRGDGNVPIALSDVTLMAVNTVVGDALFVAGSYAVACLVVLLLSIAMKKDGAIWRLPFLPGERPSLFPFVGACGGSLCAAAVAMIRDWDTTPAPFCAVAVTIALVLWMIAAYLVAQGVHTQLFLTCRPKPPPAQPGWLNRAAVIFNGYEWHTPHTEQRVSDTRGSFFMKLLEAEGVEAMFEEFRYAWYPGADLTMSLLLSTLSALPLDDDDRCRSICITSCVLCGTSLAALIILRPHATVAGIVMSTFQSIVAVLLTAVNAAYVVRGRQTRDNALVLAMDTLIVLAATVSAFRSVVDVLLAIRGVVWRVRSLPDTVTSPNEIPFCVAAKEIALPIRVSTNDALVSVGAPTVSECDEVAVPHEWDNTLFELLQKKSNFDQEEFVNDDVAQEVFRAICMPDAAVDTHSLATQPLNPNHANELLA